ncbi:MAG TPA: hypothetical protein VF550_18075 [Polyangia bacterium]
MRLMSSVALLASLATIASASRQAEAASKTEKRTTMEKAAKKACITGDVRKGIDLLGDLYVETNDATYIFNQGRCFEQNHLWSDSIDRFKEYLRKVPDLTAKEKANVDRHITDCEVEQAKLAPPTAAPIAPPAPAPLPAAAAATPPPTDTANLMARPTPPAVEQRSGSRLRTAGIVTASVGVLALAGGMVCNVQANSLAKDLSGTTYDRGKASTRDTYVTLGWVGYGVGAAALATGATLFFLGGNSGTTAETSTAVSLVPVFAPGLASLSLRGSY